MHSSSSQNLVALVGYPNSGKTTLFNWLTGASFKAVNYPGSTVDFAKGETRSEFGETSQVVDTPGVQGLSTQTPDEEVTYKILFANALPEKVQGVVVVIDGTQLHRQLDLGLRLKHAGYPLVVALTMSDLLNEAGWTIDTKALKELLGAQSVIEIDGRTGRGVKELAQTISALSLGEKVPQPPHERSLNEVIRDQLEAQKTSAQLLQKSKPDQAPAWRALSDRLDQSLLHSRFGLLWFFAIMVVLFSAIFWVADPLMGMIDDGFSLAAEQARSLLGESLWADLLADGVLASFGAVMVFVPQIFILFWGMSLLEESGYLARAATLVDRPLAKFGLSGRAFVPLLSGYACAVPAIMATRGIRAPRERLIATFVIPLLSCSARLPVYALLLSFLFLHQPAWVPGLALAVIYLMSLFLGGIAAGILHRLIPVHPQSSRLLMELPLYRRPRISVLFKSAYLRTRAYVVRAGPPIFIFALLLWMGTYFPRPSADVPDAQAVAESYLGQVGQVLEPVFEPMGVDWRVGVSLLSAFAAREVFVSALATVFNISSDLDDESLQSGLLEQMSRATFLESGVPIFTLSSVLGLVVFFMIALQCSSTVAIAWKEMKSARFATLQFLVLNGAAYVVAVLVVQGLRALGIS